MTLPDSQPDNPAFIGMWESSGNEFGTPYVQQRETLLCEVIIFFPNMKFILSENRLLLMHMQYYQIKQ